jgi:hypothetical protein
MTMLPAAAPSWCPSCGQPWEAHWRCPPPRKRGTGKLAVLAVLVAVVLLIESVLLAAWLDGAFMRSDRVSLGAVRPIVRPDVEGSLIPMVRACQLVQRWERTGRETMLDQAVAMASLPNVNRKFRPRLRTELSSLDTLGRSLDRVLQLGDGVGAVALPVHSPAAVRHERAIQVMCAPVQASYRRVLRR